MSMKEKIQEALDRIYSLWERRYFKMDELDKAQHRLTGKFERLSAQCEQIRTNLMGCKNAKEIRIYDMQIRAILAQIQSIKGEKALLVEMRHKIRLMTLEEAKLKAELLRLEVGEE